MDLGIFCHSFQQILSRSVKLNGDRRFQVYPEMFVWVQVQSLLYCWDIVQVPGGRDAETHQTMGWSLFKRGMVDLIYFLFCWITFSLICILVWYLYY